MGRSLLFLIMLIVSMSSISSGHKLGSSNSSKCQNLINSFWRVAHNFREFFRIPYDKIEQNRLKLKKRLYDALKISTEYPIIATTLPEVTTKHVDRSGAIRQEVQAESHQSHTYSDVYKAGTTSTQKPIGSSLISQHGYKNEAHYVSTEDGYVLKIVRILPVQEAVDLRRKTVLLHHDLLGSSDDWILLGPQKALPYNLCDKGYDVWLANARGNRYSSVHANRTLDSIEFWDFSWHEMGRFDLAAVIDYLSNNKSFLAIDFIGHGMGGTALLVLLSTSPKYNALINSATFLGPLIYLTGTGGPLRFLADFQSHYGDEAFSFLGETQFMPNTSFPLPFINKFCKGKSHLCLNPWLMIANGAKQIPDADLRALIDSYVPAGTSTKTISHFCQMASSGSFRMFDYGEAGNQLRYGLNEPPVYNLNNVDVSLTVFSSIEDTLATVPDASRLVAHLYNPAIHRVINTNGFVHTDFVWGQEAQTLVYQEIMLIMENLEM